jgi:hypothetical protein
LKYVLLALMTALAIGCSSSSPSPILQPIQAAGCDVESAITTAFGDLIVAQGNGPASAGAACGAAIQVALGNANLCVQSANGAPVSQITMSQIQAHVLKMKAMRAAGGKGVVAAVPDPMDIVGGLVCPLGDAAFIGFLSAGIPAACQVGSNLSAGTLNQLALAACEAAL